MLWAEHSESSLQCTQCGLHGQSACITALETLSTVDMSLSCVFTSFWPRFRLFQFTMTRITGTLRGSARTEVRKVTKCTRFNTSRGINPRPRLLLRHPRPHLGGAGGGGAPRLICPLITRVSQERRREVRDALNPTLLDFITLGYTLILPGQVQQKSVAV